MHGEIVTSLPKEILGLLKQSNESHAYPSRPFIAMPYFISFEHLIVPVSVLPPRSRRDILITTLLLTLTRTRMTTLQEDQEEEEEKDKCLVSS